MRAAVPSSWTVKAGQQFKKKKKNPHLTALRVSCVLRREQCRIENWIVISDLMVFHKFFSVSMPSGTLVSNSRSLRPNLSFYFPLLQSRTEKSGKSSFNLPMVAQPGFNWWL